MIELMPTLEGARGAVFRTRPRVILASVYPPDPALRSEDYITEMLLREYEAEEAEFELEVVIGSAHAHALQVAAKVLGRFPHIRHRLINLDSEYTGRRGEEISFCKQTLCAELVKHSFDYLMFLDADVWTSIRQVPAWIAEIEPRPGTDYVKIKYALRDALLSPVHTLGAYFHHRDLMARTQYWDVMFPKKEDGSRKGAPDCHLHHHLRATGCRRIIPASLRTYHFIDRKHAHSYHDDTCRLVRNARKVIEASLTARAAKEAHEAK